MPSTEESVDYRGRNRPNSSNNILLWGSPESRNLWFEWLSVASILSLMFSSCSSTPSPQTFSIFYNKTRTNLYFQPQLSLSCLCFSLTDKKTHNEKSKKDDEDEEVPRKVQTQNKIQLHYNNVCLTYIFSHSFFRRKNYRHRLVFSHHFLLKNPNPRSVSGSSSFWGDASSTTRVSLFKVEWIKQECTVVLSLPTSYAVIQVIEEDEGWKESRRPNVSFLHNTSIAANQQKRQRVLILFHIFIQLFISLDFLFWVVEMIVVSLSSSFSLNQSFSFLYNALRLVRHTKQQQRKHYFLWRLLLTDSYDPF
jgi:hypothetical protein